MKKSNVIIFVVIILVVLAIFGYAIWDANRTLNQMDNGNAEQTQGGEEPGIQDGNNNGNGTGSGNTNNYNYVGEWFISQEAYNNAQIIDEILDKREDHLISDQEFEAQMSSERNSNIVELDVESYNQNTIRFDFQLTSPAPTQREAKLDDIIVTLTDNIGTFTYTDNWGTSGNGTITLEEGKITLKLETTSAAQGALWGVEGIYTFSYKRMD